MPDTAKPNEQNPQRPTAADESTRTRTAAAPSLHGLWVPAYLAAVEITGGNFTKAARAAKVHRSTVWEWRRDNDEFAKAEADACRRGMKTLHAEAIRRAVDGVRSIRFQPKTGTIHYERVYSDTLLLRALEHAETGSWRQKQQVEHSGGVVFKTRAERKAALEAARAAMAQSAVRIPMHGAS
jgi:hypothetical protein